MHRKITMLQTAYAERNWTLIRFILRRWWLGLITWHCIECRCHKSPTSSRKCEQCHAVRMWDALKDGYGDSLLDKL